MRITRVTTRIVNAEMRNWIFVRVDTDVDGLYGWGEATLEWKTRAVDGAVKDLEPLIIGRDPRDIELLAARRHRYLGNLGHRDRIVGHIRQIGRFAGMAPVGRPGARPRQGVHPSWYGRHARRV